MNVMDSFQIKDNVSNVRFVCNRTEEKVALIIYYINMQIDSVIL